MYHLRFWQILVAFYAMTSAAQEQRSYAPLPYAKNDSSIDSDHKGTHYEKNITLTHHMLINLTNGDG